MKNKILLSVVASALLTTTAFASGTLNLSGGSGTSATEYAEKYGAVQALNLGSLVYTADITGSGSVSDALIRIDLTDTNLSGTANAGLDVANGGAPAVLMNDENETVAVYDKKITVNGRTYFLFDGDATKSIVDGINYRIAKDDNTSIDVSYGFVTGGNNEIKLDVYSTSGTEQRRDEAVGTVISSKVAQFKTNCVAKFDGLINIESLQDSFVNTNHDNASAGEVTDGLSQWDTLVFTVTNNRPTSTTPFYMDGNASAITMQTRNADGTINVDNNFSNPNIWNSQIVEVQQNGVSTTYALAYDNASLTTKAALTNPTAATGTWNYTTDGNLTFVLPSDRVIPVGTTTYYIGLQHNAGNGGIKPVHFVNARLALEAGLADNNNTIYPAGDTPRGAALDAGEWQNHAYIAQIAGATQDAATQTKLFIVNRSCAPVTPRFRLIKDGVVTEVTGTEIAVDTQSKTLLSTLLTQAGLADGRYAVEIILPGIAENFYVYAQAQGKADKSITKDLPVNNTSERN